MKFLHTFIFVILLLALHTCKKEEKITNYSIPDWLQSKITELLPDQDLCKITDITIIEYKGQIYYHIYCGIWSCVYCQLFDEQGNRPAWDTNSWNDFLAQKKEIEKIPACK
jgi:hypothetical protein